MRNSFAKLWSLALAAALAVPLGAAARASAQTVEMPQTVTAAVGRLAVVEMRYDGDDFQFSVPPELDAFREYTNDPNIVKLRVIGYTNGTFQVTAVASKAVDGKGMMSPFKSCLIHIGGTPPVPVPPVPVPPDPDPTPTPVPTGKRVVWIVYESTQQTIELGKLLTTIRQPPHADYLIDKGHVLAQIDDDMPDLPPEGVAMRPHVQGMALPVVLIAEKGTNKLVHKQTIPNNWTAANVIELVRAHGG